MLTRRLSLVALAALVLTAAGCGGDGRPRRVPVSGQVFMNGEPLTMGYVRIVPEGDRMSQGKIGPDGRFTMGMFGKDDGVVPGTHKVAVIAKQTFGPTAIRHLVPPEFADPHRSGVTVTIEKATDDLKINLERPGWKPFTERTESTGDADPAKQ